MVKNKGVQINSPHAQFMYFLQKSYIVIPLIALELQFMGFAVAYTQIDFILSSSHFSTGTTGTHGYITLHKGGILNPIGHCILSNHMDLRLTERHSDHVRSAASIHRTISLTQFRLHFV